MPIVEEGPARPSSAASASPADIEEMQRKSGGGPRDRAVSADALFCAFRTRTRSTTRALPVTGLRREKAGFVPSRSGSASRTSARLRPDHVDDQAARPPASRDNPPTNRRIEPTLNDRVAGCGAGPPLFRLDAEAATPCPRRSGRIASGPASPDQPDPARKWKHPSGGETTPPRAKAVISACLPEGTAPREMYRQARTDRRSHS